MREDNFYSVLQVSKNASKAEIRKKYIELAKIYHPDIYKGSDEKIKSINVAYLTLRDSDIRRIYDLWLVYQEINRLNDNENEFVKDQAEAVDVFLQPEYFVSQNVKFVMLAILITGICLIAGISDINSVGVRDLLFGVVFAIYFVFLIAILRIA
jgi:hypothetical protein